jgi:hypothetical protein
MSHRDFSIGISRRDGAIHLRIRRLQPLEIFAKNAALGFVEVGELIEDLEGRGVEAAGAFVIAVHLVDDGEVPEAESDFGMVRTEELLPYAKGLHVALFGAEQVAAFAEDSTEIGGDERGFSVHGTVAAGGLFKGAGEQDRSFLEFTGKFAQHGQIVEAHGHVRLITGQIVEIGRLGVMSTGRFRLAEVLLGRGHFGSDPCGFGGTRAARQNLQRLRPAGNSFPLVAT